MCGPRYWLAGVVCHTGGLGSGHYYAFVRHGAPRAGEDPERVWALMDDASMTSEPRPSFWNASVLWYVREALEPMLHVEEAAAAAAAGGTAPAIVAASAFRSVGSDMGTHPRGLP